MSLTLDIPRLYRYLTGQSREIVLGGGGAIGMAHVSAIKGFDKLSYLFRRDKSFPSLLTTFMKTTMANCEQHVKSVQDHEAIFFQPKGGILVCFNEIKSKIL